MSKTSKRLTSTKRVIKLLLLMLLAPVMLLSACQTQSTQSVPVLQPMPALEVKLLERQETYSKYAADNIASWQKQLIDLQTAYEQSQMQIDDE